MEKTSITIRLPIDLASQLRHHAVDQQRSVSAIAEEAIAGVLVKKKKPAEDFDALKAAVKPQPKQEDVPASWEDPVPREKVSVEDVKKDPNLVARPIAAEVQAAKVPPEIAHPGYKEPKADHKHKRDRTITGGWWGCSCGKVSPDNGATWK